MALAASKSAALDEKVVMMRPFARRSSRPRGRPAPVLCMDQTEVGRKHAILTVALRSGKRAAPLCWQVEADEANIGSEAQIELLKAVKG